MLLSYARGFFFRSIIFTYCLLTLSGRTSHWMAHPVTYFPIAISQKLRLYRNLFCRCLKEHSIQNRSKSFFIKFFHFFNGRSTIETYIKNFHKATVGYSVAMYVLGVGDRHNDNIMLKKDTGQVLNLFYFTWRLSIQSTYYAAGFVSWSTICLVELSASYIISSVHISIERFHCTLLGLVRLTLFSCL